MLLRFSIKNYLSIKDEVVLDMVATKNEKHLDFFCQQVGDYKVLKLAMLFGPNASGKTNILISLQHCLKLVTEERNRDEKIKSIPFRFSPATVESPSQFSIDILLEKKKFRYELEFNEKEVLSENFFSYPHKALIYSRRNNPNGSVELKFGSKYPQSNSIITSLALNTATNNTVLAAYRKTSINITEISLLLNWFLTYFKPMITPGTNLSKYVMQMLKKNNISKNELISMLRQADFNLSDLSMKDSIIPKEVLDQLRENSPHEYYKLMQNKNADGDVVITSLDYHHTIKDDYNSQTYTLPEFLESEGTLRFFGFSGVLLSNMGSSYGLMVDELGSSLHPDLMIHFINSFMLNTSESQMIFTTHYLPLLEDTDELRKDVVWFTEKREDGSTDLYSLKDIEIRSALNYYKAYKVGKLGAKPFIGSAYLNIHNEEG